MRRPPVNNNNHFFKKNHNAILFSEKCLPELSCHALQLCHHVLFQSAKKWKTKKEVLRKPLVCCAIPITCPPPGCASSPAPPASSRSPWPFRPGASPDPRTWTSAAPSACAQVKGPCNLDKVRGLGGHKAIQTNSAKFNAGKKSRKKHFSFNWRKLKLLFLNSGGEIECFLPFYRNVANKWLWPESWTLPERPASLSAPCSRTRAAPWSWQTPVIKRNVSFKLGKQVCFSLFLLVSAVPIGTRSSSCPPGGPPLDPPACKKL